MIIKARHGVCQHNIVRHDLITYGLVQWHSVSNTFVSDEIITHYLKEYIVSTGSRTIRHDHAHAEDEWEKHGQHYAQGQ